MIATCGHKVFEGISCSLKLSEKEWSYGTYCADCLKIYFENNEVDSESEIVKLLQQLAKLKETIKAKDAEIARLRNRSLTEAQAEMKMHYEKAIAEAREIIASSYDFIEDGDFMHDRRKALCEKAKAWLENNC